MKREIIQSSIFLRTNNNTISSEVIEFMKNTSIERLEQIEDKKESTHRFWYLEPSNSFLATQIPLLQEYHHFGLLESYYIHSEDTNSNYSRWRLNIYEGYTCLIISKNVKIRLSSGDFHIVRR